MGTTTFHRAVMDARADRRRAEAKPGTAAVFHALRDRLTRDEAVRLAAQPPWELKKVWPAGGRAERTPVKLQLLSPGEADHVLAQLPKDLKELWSEARVPA